MASNCYFSHDSNARNDEKILLVRMKHGLEGYAIYFMLLERLRDEEDYTSARDYNLIAYDLRADAGIVKSVVETFGLFDFTDDEKRFFSRGLKKRMEFKALKDETRSSAGKKASEARWNAVKPPNRNATAMQTQCERNANAMQTQCKEKKRKEKESKEADASCACAHECGGGELFGVLFSYFRERYPELTETAEQHSKLETLVNALGGVNVAQSVIIQGLERLRLSEPVNAGKIEIRFESFLNPDTFAKIQSGRYDKDYSKKSPEPAEKESPEDVRKSIWRELGYDSNCWDMNGNPPAWDADFWENHPNAKAEFKRKLEER